jgi:hypothetical protein
VTVYSITPNQGLSGGQIFRTVNQEKPQKSAVSVLNRKLLIWLQKHYIHINLNLIVFSLNPLYQKKKTKNRLKLGFIAQDNLSPVFCQQVLTQKTSASAQGPWSCVVHDDHS